MSNKLEHTVEEYFVELFRLNGTISSILDDEQIKHSDDDAQADADGLVVQAIQGERHLDGAKGAFDVELHVLLRSFNLTSDQNEQLIDSVVDSVYDPMQSSFSELAEVRAQLSYLLILDEMSGERVNTKQTRKREKIFPLIAKGV